MESRNELHEKLEAMLKKSNEDLELTKKQLEKENKKLFLVKERLYNSEKAYFEETYGFDFNEIEDSLLESVYRIINP